MSKHKSWWLALQPYVHIAVYGNQVLFYNTLDHRMIEYNDNPEIAHLASRLLDEANGLVVGLDGKEMNRGSLAQAVRKLCRFHMASLIPADYSQSKPVQILPRPAFKQRLKPYEKGIERSGIRPENFIRVLNLHLNAGPAEHTGLLQGAFKQFPYPATTGEFGLNMTTGLIRKIISEISAVPLLTLNILGVDLPAHPDWITLTEFLRSKDVSVKYHVPLPLLTGKDYTPVGRRAKIALYISFPLYEEDFSALLNLDTILPEKCSLEYNFIITSLDDLEKAKQVIAHLSLKNTFFNPFFTGSNLDFFEQNVFITQEDVYQSKPDQHQIFSRITFNENDFGKFTVFPDGTAFANVNDPPLGNLNHTDMIALIKTEMDHGLSWSRTRLRVPPCNTCVYNFICPPVSSYEIGLNKFNFCHIR